MNWTEVKDRYPKSAALLVEMFADNGSEANPDFVWTSEILQQLSASEPFAATLNEEQASLFACGEEGEKDDFLQGVPPAFKRSASALDTLLNECFDGKWYECHRVIGYETLKKQGFNVE